MNRNVKAPDERRAEFVATAQKLFYTKGYDRTSVNDIIKAVGLSKGAFYHYFDSKQAVLEAVVDQLVERSVGLMRLIIDDPTLDAITKFKAMRRQVSARKLEHKTEMITIGRILRSEENVRLFTRLRKTGENQFVPQMARIIEQGVKEQVFETPHPYEAAEFVLVVMSRASDAFLDLLLDPHLSDDPAMAAKKKFEAAQTAIERILSAPAGSLPFIDDETVEAWFE